MMKNKNNENSAYGGVLFMDGFIAKEKDRQPLKLCKKLQKQE